MKVIYQNETKRIPNIATYNGLIGAIIKAFEINNGLQFGRNIKLYYMDEDGDIVSVTGQGDLDEAKEAMVGTMRFVVASNNDVARQILGQSAIDRSQLLN